MSKSYSEPVKYTCSNGCEPYAHCPGHEVREVFDRSMDIYTFEIDGKPVYSFDESLWHAMLKATGVDFKKQEWPG